MYVKVLPGLDKFGLLETLEQDLFNGLNIIFLDGKPMIVTTQICYLQCYMSGVVPEQRKPFFQFFMIHYKSLPKYATFSATSFELNLSIANNLSKFHNIL